VAAPTTQGTLFNAYETNYSVGTDTDVASLEEFKSVTFNITIRPTNRCPALFTVGGGNRRSSVFHGIIDQWFNLTMFHTECASQSNLVREFKGMSAADSAKCTKAQRVQAIALHIQSAMMLGKTAKYAIPTVAFTPSPIFESTFASAIRSATTPIDLVDYEHLRTYSVQEQVKIICDLLDAAGLSAKE
jgi:hypothetical protein